MKKIIAMTLIILCSSYAMAGGREALRGALDAMGKSLDRGIEIDNQKELMQRQYELDLAREKQLMEYRYKLENEASKERAANYGNSYQPNPKRCDYDDKGEVVCK